MMEFRQGNIFDASAQALVNPVNCVGVMGKGLALQFKEKFPDNFHEYADICRKGQLKPGVMFVHNTHRPDLHRYIINFPTKRHWRDRSLLMDIEEGIQALADEIRTRRIDSVAIPALGAGLGGLPWSRVRPIIENGLAHLQDTRITVYEPTESRRRR